MGAKATSRRFFSIFQNIVHLQIEKAKQAAARPEGRTAACQNFLLCSGENDQCRGQDADQSRAHADHADSAGNVIQHIDGAGLHVRGESIQAGIQPGIGGSDGGSHESPPSPCTSHRKAGTRRTEPVPQLLRRWYRSFLLRPAGYNWAGIRTVISIVILLFRKNYLKQTHRRAVSIPQAPIIKEGGSLLPRRAEDRRLSRSLVGPPTLSSEESCSSTDQALDRVFRGMPMPPIRTVPPTAVMVAAMLRTAFQAEALV